VAKDAVTDATAKAAGLAAAMSFLPWLSPTQQARAQAGAFREGGVDYEPKVSKH
jgi:uncharacterized membrane protein